MYIDSLRNNIEAVLSDLNPFTFRSGQRFTLEGKGLYFCGTRTTRKGKVVVVLQEKPSGCDVPEKPVCCIGAVLFVSLPDKGGASVQGLRVVCDTRTRFCCEKRGSVHEFALTIT